MSWIGNVGKIKAHADVIKCISYAMNYNKTQKRDIEDVAQERIDINNCYVYSSIPINDIGAAGRVAKAWNAVREQYNKNDKILVHHFVQSISPEHGVTPEESFAIGKKLAEEIFGKKGFEYVITTHVEEGKVIHNHIVVNNVSTTTGKKYPHNKETYAKMRKLNINICRQYGIDAVDTGLTDRFKDAVIMFSKTEDKCSEELPKRYSRKTYNTLPKYDSWKYRKENNTTTVKRDIRKVIKYANDWKDFVNKMEELGYKVDWKTKSGEEKKYVTYFPPGADAGRRDRKLEGLSKNEIEDAILSRVTKEYERNEYYQIRNERNEEYLKNKVNKEYEYLLLLKQKAFQQRFGTMIYSNGRFWYKKKNLFRMSYIEQKYLEQYQKYKNAIIAYESSQAKQEVAKKAIPKDEYDKCIRDIYKSIDNIRLIRTYHITKKEDIATAIKQITENKQLKVEAMNKMRNRVLYYDDLLSKIRTINKNQDIKDTYDKLDGKDKNEYRYNNIQALDSMAITLRDLERQEISIEQEIELIDARKSLYIQLDKYDKEINKLDEEINKVNNIFEEEPEKNITGKETIIMPGHPGI